MHMLATLKIRSGKMGEAFERIGAMVPLIEKQVGWKLVGGFHSLSGHTHTLVHLWDLGDSYDRARAGLTKAPDLQKVIQPILELLEEEVTMYLEKTPYSH